MSRRSTQAFSLLEALCMIVTLFVFGWLCVGVFHYDMKHDGENFHSSLKFTTREPDQEAEKTVAPTAKTPEKPANKPVDEAPRTDSQPAGSPAPAKP